MSGLADRLGLAAFALASLAGVGLAATWPGDRSRAVAVVFPPGTGAAVAAAQATRAGAVLVGYGRAPFVVLVRPSADDYPRRARRQGAVLVLDAGDLRGCSSGPKQRT